MFYNLNDRQQSWADSVFDALTMEEKVAQLLHPNFSGQSESDLQELVKKVPFGSFFTGTQDFAVLRQRRESEALFCYGNAVIHFLPIHFQWDGGFF